MSWGVPRKQPDSLCLKDKYHSYSRIEPAKVGGHGGDGEGGSDDEVWSAEVCILTGGWVCEGNYLLE